MQGEDRDSGNKWCYPSWVEVHWHSHLLLFLNISPSSQELQKYKLETRTYCGGLTLVSPPYPDHAIQNKWWLWWQVELIQQCQMSIFYYVWSFQTGNAHKIICILVCQYWKFLGRFAEVSRWNTMLIDLPAPLTFSSLFWEPSGVGIEEYKTVLGRGIGRGSRPCMCMISQW